MVFAVVDIALNARADGTVALCARRCAFSSRHVYRLTTRAAGADIDKHVLRRYEIQQKLGKGVRVVGDAHTRLVRRFALLASATKLVRGWRAVH